MSRTYIQVRAELEMIYQIHSYTAETEKSSRNAVRTAATS